MIKSSEILNEIEKTYVYFDVVKIYIKHILEQWELDTLLSLCGSCFYRNLSWHDEKSEYIDQHMKARGYKSSINLTQPSDDAFRFLMSRLVNSSRYTISYVEIAIDWIILDQKKAIMLHKFIESRLVKKYHRKEHPIQKAFSVTEEFGLIKEQPTTNIGSKKNKSQFSIYSGLPSRHFGDKSCCHAEFRIQDSRNVKRMRIRTVADLLLFDYVGFWGKRLCLYEIDTEKLGKLINGIHLNARSRIISRGRYSINIDKYTGARILRLCLYENNLMDFGMDEIGQVGQAQFTALKEHVKKYDLDLKLNRVLIKVDNRKLLGNIEQPEVLARIVSITM